MEGWSSTTIVGHAYPSDKSCNKLFIARSILDTLFDTLIHYFLIHIFSFSGILFPWSNG